MSKVRIYSKTEITDFGKITYWSDKNNTLRFALYSYSDDNKFLYLSNVYVSPELRGRGFGDRVLDFAFEKAKDLNYKKLCLNVKKDSWVEDWYKRRGFVPFEDCGKDYPGNVWMVAKV